MAAAVQIIPDHEARKIRLHLDQALKAPVVVDLFTRAQGTAPPGQGGEGAMCEETRQLLDELAALSERIVLRTHDIDAEAELAAAMGVDRVPSLVLSGAARGRVRYVGIPSGYEFGTLLADLSDVASGATDLAPATLEALRGLERDVHIRVFVTPTCPFCPAAARLAHKMAVASERVTADVVEATEFPDLAQRYDVRGVPRTVINEVIHLVGAQPEKRVRDEVLRAAGARRR